jgi:hypothetical protein
LLHCLGSWRSRIDDDRFQGEPERPALSEQWVRFEIRAELHLKPYQL